MTKVIPFIINLLSVLALMVSTSCSSSSAPEPGKEMDAKEIKAKTKSSLDLPELELFSNAKRQYQSGLYSIARDSFTAIKDNYPTGAFAEYSELKKLLIRTFKTVTIRVQLWRMKNSQRTGQPHLHFLMLYCGQLAVMNFQARELVAILHRCKNH